MSYNNSIIKAVLLLLSGVFFISNGTISYAQTAGTLGAIAASPAPLTAGISSAEAALVQAAVTQAIAGTKGNPLLAGAPVINPVNKAVIDKKAKEDRLIQKEAALKDPNSRDSKALRLANESIAKRKRQKAFDPKLLEEESILKSPPPNIETLQYINKTLGGSRLALIDDPINKKISVDMRHDAQREAALSYGARGGLAKRSAQIMERTRGFGKVLDRVFNFRALLITAPSGLLIEPPIVKESMDALVIKENGNEAAVADRVFDINKNAKIVSAPRDWRHYIVQEWSDVPPPPRILWPKNSKEQRNWNIWIEQGWRAGVRQADEMFELNVNKLSADYSGMVRYRVLLAQGMISAPYTMHEERGVTSSKNQMRIGESALKITGPSQFITGANIWKPADQ